MAQGPALLESNDVPFVQEQEGGSNLATREAENRGDGGLTLEVRLPQTIRVLDTGLRALAEILSKSLTPVEATQVLEKLKGLEKDVEALGKAARDHALGHILDKGVQVDGTKGTLEVDLGDGTYLRGTLMKSGLDDKKFESLLRAKGLSPAQYMDADIKYKVNYVKVDELQANNIVTFEEAQTCKPVQTYRVTTGSKKQGSSNSNQAED